MPRILVLDDNASIRLLYEEELTEEGYDVSCENDGVDLDKLVCEMRPDLIVLDLKLGSTSGGQVLGKRRGEDVSVPVILCTAYPFSPKEAKTMGAGDLVIKSSDLSELKAKIKKALSGNASALL